MTGGRPTSVVVLVLPPSQEHFVKEKSLQMGNKKGRRFGTQDKVTKVQPLPSPVILIHFVCYDGI